MSGVVVHDRAVLVAAQRPLDGSLASLRGEQIRRLSHKDPKELAKEFGAILLAEAIKAMRQTVPRDGLLTPSAYHGVYDGLFDLELARSVVQRAGLGVDVNDAFSRPTPRDGALEAGGELVAREKNAGGLDFTSGQSLGGPRLAAAQAGENKAVRGDLGPLSGPVTSGFGYRKDPIDGTRRFHAGLDIAAPAGSPIRAVDGGEVVFSGWRAGTGYTVVVAHEGDLTSTYAHARSLAVLGGQKVAAGQVIASVGESGRTTGPHLHLELRFKGKPVDPASILGAA